MRRGSVKLGAALATAALAASVVAVGATTAGAAAKPTGTPIKLMTIFEKSAGIGNPDTADGAIAAAKAITKAGGLGGRPVQVIVCDTANDPNKAADCGRQAVDQGVAAMVGNLSIYSAQFMPLMVQNKIAVHRAQSGGRRRLHVGGRVPDHGWRGRHVRHVAARARAVRCEEDRDGPARPRRGRRAQDVRQRCVEDGRPDDRQRRPGPDRRADMSSYVAAATANGVDGVVVGLWPARTR